jgi:hypothetical protein
VATKKVRRRREKLKRHEYELVVENEEGEEVPVERPKAAAPKDGKQPVDRRGRPVQKPSLERTLKRGAIFVPIIVVVVFLLGGELTTGQKIFQAAVLALIFLPFSHLMDLLVYRMSLKRQARENASGDSGRKS